MQVCRLRTLHCSFIILIIAHFVHRLAFSAHCPLSVNRYITVVIPVLANNTDYHTTMDYGTTIVVVHSNKQINVCQFAETLEAYLDST